MRSRWVQVVMAALGLLGSACFVEVDENRPRREGEGCALSAQCTAGLVCGDVSGRSACRWPTLGEPCMSTTSDGCGNGLVCSHGQCSAPGSKVEGQECSYNVDCGKGLVCNWSSYRCQPPALVDETCGHPNDCRAGLVCPDVLIGVRACECPSCPAGLVCGAKGCIKPGSADDGERCLHNTDCKGDAVCVWAEKPYVCAAARQQGEACGHPTDCVAGLSCDSVTSTCAPRCASDEECGDGEACLSSGVCGARRSEGAHCGQSSDCAADLWCDEGTCAPRRDVGGPCVLWPSGDAACKDGLSCVVRCFNASQTLDGTCEIRLPEGSACDACPVTADDEQAKALLGPLYNDAGCQTGLVCEGGACAEATPSP